MTHSGFEAACGHSANFLQSYLIIYLENWK